MLENFKVDLPQFEISELPGSDPQKASIALSNQFQITKSEVAREASRTWIAG